MFHKARGTLRVTKILLTSSADLPAVRRSDQVARYQTCGRSEACSEEGRFETTYLARHHAQLDDVAAGVESWMDKGGSHAREIIQDRRPVRICRFDGRA